MLSNPTLAQGFATAFQKALETKGMVDRNMRMLLGLLSIPSSSDVMRLLGKLEVMQGSLANLHEKLDRVLAQQKPRRRAKPRPKRPAPTPDTDLPPE